MKTKLICIKRLFNKDFTLYDVGDILEVRSDRLLPLGIIRKKNGNKLEEKWIRISHFFLPLAEFRENRINKILDGDLG
jgi:hypothetical protein